MSPASSTAVDRIVGGLVSSLSVEAAESVASSKLDSETQELINRLADKAARGELSEVERQEYVEIVDAIDLLSAFQAKVRKALGKRLGQ